MEEEQQKTPGGRRIEFFYSNMTRYFQEVYDDSKTSAVEYRVFDGEFWEYDHEATFFWTGFYSTYPEFKRHVYAFDDFAEAAIGLTTLDLRQND